VSNLVKLFILYDCTTSDSEKMIKRGIGVDRGGEKRELGVIAPLDMWD